MYAIRKFLNSCFGYTRRERRSAFILLNIIIIVMGVRYLFPSVKTDIQEITQPVSSDFQIRDTVKKENPVEYQISGVRQEVKRRPKTDLNRCDSASLEALPGIGPVLSSRIIKYRNLLGGFVSVAQLKEVYGLPEDTYKLISAMVYADTLAIRKIRINEAEYRDLIRHPYLKKEEVAAILRYRQLSGRLTGTGEMMKNHLISGDTYKKIRSYIEFE
jgi:DNA uptake protein ComE-like DNA-binding protein